MNTRLLKLAERDRRGIRRWTVPGHGNGITFIPASAQTWPGWGAGVRWPHADGVRSVDLDRHRRLAKQEIRKLLQSI